MKSWQQKNLFIGILLAFTYNMREFKQNISIQFYLYSSKSQHSYLKVLYNMISGGPLFVKKE